MILSGEDIHTALAEGRMVIDPPPGKENIDTTSIDLHIGEPLWIWDPALRKGGAPKVSLDQFDYKEFSERHLVEVQPDEKGRYHIEPQEVYLASTFEKVEFPVGSRLAGRVEGKSTLARLGLMVHMTAPVIHCGTGLGMCTMSPSRASVLLPSTRPGRKTSTPPPSTCTSESHYGFGIRRCGKAEPQKFHWINLTTRNFPNVTWWRCNRTGKAVIAIHVGYGQLDWKLQSDERVTLVDRKNARHLVPADIEGESVDLAVIDVAFISLKLIRPSASAVCMSSPLKIMRPSFQV